MMLLKTISTMLYLDLEGAKLMNQRHSNPNREVLLINIDRLGAQKRFLVVMVMASVNGVVSCQMPSQPLAPITTKSSVVPDVPVPTLTTLASLVKLSSDRRR